MQHEWHLKRNCSLSPRQVMQAYGMLCAFVFVIGGVFALQGIWFVFAFAVIEIGAVVLALLHYARHATDQEHIALSESCLLVERIEAGQLRQVTLDPHWTKIVLPGRRRSLILLESRGVQVEIGGFVSVEARHQFGLELRRELKGSSYLC